MPKVTFASENKVATTNDFPRLTLEHNERALILAIEQEPEMEFTHALRAPEIGPDGRVIKTIEQGKKGEYEKVSTEFIGQHLCFGDFDVLSSKGVDPANCPTCRAAVEGEGIDPPKPRYAMNVIRYGIQPGGFQVKIPFTVTVEAWVFAGNRFNTLVDLAAEWGDLRKHDLKLGPCESKNYQKYDIQPSQQAQWLLDDERKQLVVATYQNNKAADLSTLIGRKVGKDQAMQDILRVQERVAQAYGRGTAVSNVPSVNTTAASIDSEVSSLLGGDKPAESAPAAEVDSDVTVETPDVAPETVAKDPASMSFEDILGTL